jgi:Ca2+-binding RTX toxin-like protein
MALLMAACTKAPDTSDAGSAPSSGGTSGTTKPRAGNGAAGTAGRASQDAGTPSDAGFLDDDGGVLTNKQLFEGVPFDAVKEIAPVGCLNNSAGSADTLVLQLDVKVTAVRVGARNGHITANDTSCSATGVKTIKILGTAAVDTVIIDGSQGAFPAGLLADGGGIDIDLMTGKDVVAVMGSLDADNFKLGSNGSTALITSAGKFPKITVHAAQTLIVSGGPGDDSISGRGGSAAGSPLNVPLKAWGGLGADALNGGDMNDELHGGQGDDVFETAAAPDGADIYDGASGVDTLSYDQRSAPLSVKLNDAADDGEANERDNVQSTVENLVGGSGADSLTGSAADNVFIGGPGNDTLNGGDGNDTFLEAAAPQGNDIMNGGAGSDLVDYSGRTINMTLTLCISTPASCVSGACGCANNDGEEGEADTLANIENAATGSGNDIITGNAEDNTITAGAGNDELYGLAGDDTLFGEAGNDKLVGAEGDDSLYGGGGADTLDAGPGQGDICIGEVRATLISCELH